MWAMMYAELSKWGVVARALYRRNERFRKRTCSTHVTLASLSDSPVNPSSSSLWLDRSSYAQRPLQLRPRPPRISPVCSLLRHVGCRTRPATPGFPHQSTLSCLADSIPIHSQWYPRSCLCGHGQQHFLHDACIPSTYPGWRPHFAC